METMVFLGVALAGLIFLAARSNSRKQAASGIKTFDLGLTGYPIVEVNAGANSIMVRAGMTKHHQLQLHEITNITTESRGLLAGGSVHFWVNGIKQYSVEERGNQKKIDECLAYIRQYQRR